MANVETKIEQAQNALEEAQAREHAHLKSPAKYLRSRIWKRHKDGLICLYGRPDFFCSRSRNIVLGMIFCNI